ENSDRVFIPMAAVFDDEQRMTKLCHRIVRQSIAQRARVSREKCNSVVFEFLLRVDVDRNNAAIAGGLSRDQVCKPKRASPRFRTYLDYRQRPQAAHELHVNSDIERTFEKGNAAVQGFHDALLHG